jgi:hypothetical protein
MPVSLTRSGTGDVAVLTLDREQSIRFLCRSLGTGTAFAAYPAVLIDLRHVAPIEPRTRAAVETAARTCLTRHQLVGVVEPGERVGHVITQARQARRLLQNPAPATFASLRGVVQVLFVLAHDADAFVRNAGRARARTPAEPGRPRQRAREVGG